jgi:hypothetical protein
MPLLGFGQISQQELEAEILRVDSLIFQVSFNNCDMSGMKNTISDNFEFYHDLAGSIVGKENFIKTFESGLCNPANTWVSRRQLIEHKVYPLKKNGQIYGAVQEGIHSFFERDKSGSSIERPGSIAKFTSLWLLENGSWKYVRGLSFDHKPQ